MKKLTQRKTNSQTLFLGTKNHAKHNVLVLHYSSLRPVLQKAKPFMLLLLFLPLLIGCTDKAKLEEKARLLAQLEQNYEEARENAYQQELIRLQIAKSMDDAMQKGKEIGWVASTDAGREKFVEVNSNRMKLNVLLDTYEDRMAKCISGYEGLLFCLDKIDSIDKEHQVRFPFGPGVVETKLEVVELKSAKQLIEARIEELKKSLTDFEPKARSLRESLQP